VSPTDRQSRWLPATCGAAAFLLVVLTWGSLAKLPIGNDEMAYLVQARIFATGRIAGDPRPFPEFFQQYHVFVDPVLAAKYPPGHSLLLTLGVWLGLPGLVPALLVALTAAILCDTTMRLTDAKTAVLAVLLATTSDIALRFDGSYFSETTTAAVFALVWWGLFRYWRSGGKRWLLVSGVAMGLGVVTRPYTMLAFGVPAAVCGAMLLHKRRRWRDAVPGAVAAVAVLSIVPVWNARVTGRWNQLTQSEYARQYMPSDRLGFGVSDERPAAHLSPEQDTAQEVVRRMHEQYSLADVPRAAANRASWIAAGTWSYGGIPGIAVLAGMLLLPLGVSCLILATVLTIFAAYLGYAHSPSWTLYYLEFQAPLALMTAVGLSGTAAYAARSIERRTGRMPSASKTTERLVFGVLFVWLLLPVPSRLLSYREAHAGARHYHERFEAAAAKLGRAIVFVRYAPGHGEERLIDNVPVLASAPLWVVHDCGAANSKLLALAAGRDPFLYEEAVVDDSTVFTIRPLAPPNQGAAEAASVLSC
jgi:hypothetical protein